MAAKCYSLLHLCRFRAIRIDAAGAMVAGSNNGYVTANAISLAVEADWTDGEERELVGGCGGRVAVYRDPDRFNRNTFTLDLATVEPELIELLTGEALITDAGTPAAGIGNSYPLITHVQPRVAVEAWADLQAGDAPPTDFPYMRFVWPATRWRKTGGTLENDFQPQTLEGRSEANPAWGAGPLATAETGSPAGTPKAKVVGAMGGRYYDVGRPSAQCGYLSLT